MEELTHQENTPESYVSYDSLLGKWIRFLLPVQIAGTVLVVLAAFQFGTQVINLLSQVLGICITVALFAMAPANKSYRTSAILRCVCIGGNLLSMIGGAALLSLPVSICSIIGSYLEYRGHAQVVWPKNPILSRKWRKLFVWQLVVGIVTGIFTTAVAVVAMIAGMGTERTVTVMLLITALITACVQVFYLLYLKRMQIHFPKGQKRHPYL